MKDVWNKMKETLLGPEGEVGYSDEFDKDYLEIDTENSKNLDRNKVKVKSIRLLW